ncbi:hypothetical protein CALVIDRAFT_542855 [Calocera viscosa TUFC12733]|uniref:Uncharacterized protein n=1 Tax=Calocera viscosa (strain TUFC12733) TaxID=1330018 RepID=A0A167G6U7_CALVF|nr:hypothetical protein CALVIDRAFT_542855 [Calocera viscosa TUFC12733]
MESMIELHRSAVSTTGLSDSQHHTMCQGYAGTAIAADLAQLRNATLFLSLHKAEPFSQILRKELESLRTCEGLVYETFSFAIYPNSLPTLLKSAIDVMRSVCERRTVPVHFEQRARATSANFSFGTTSITYRPAVAIRELEGALLLAIPLTSLPRADLLHQLISALSPNALRCGSSVAEERPYALQLKILPTEGVTARYEALRLLDTSIDTCQAMRPDAYANFRRRCIASVLQRRKTADGIQSRVDWNKYCESNTSSHTPGAHVSVESTIWNNYWICCTR